MIAERAAELREQLAVRQANLLSHNQRVHMVQRLDDLQTLASELEAATDYLREAPGRHVLIEGDRTSLEAARQAVSEYRAAFSADPVTALQDETFGGLQRSLKAAARTLSSTAQAHWDKAAQVDRWEQLAPMLRALEQVAPEGSTFFYKVRKLVDLVDALTRMAGQQSPSAATRKAFAEKREDFDQLWADLAGEEGVPDGLVDFLGAAHRTEGAPLEALSEPIRGWLEEHGIFGSLRVRIR